MITKNTETYKDSYVTECMIQGRGNEILFHMKENGEVLARLRGYAIIPIEEYEKLVQPGTATKKIKGV